MNNAAPSLKEILQLTLQELVIEQPDDLIRECGRAALALRQKDPGTCRQLAYQKLHDVPYKEVRTCWRRLYTDASTWEVLRLVEADIEGHVEWIDEVVKRLDMALILTGAPTREELVELWFAALKEVLRTSAASKCELEKNGDARPAKRRRVSPSPRILGHPTTFPTKISEPSPRLKFPVERSPELGLSSFQTKLSTITTHTPLIIEGAIQHWPALQERPWNSPSDLLEQTLGGRRLVPIELGKTYTDTAWTQKIISFKNFLETYMLNPPNFDHNDDSVSPTGYLAQHDLFTQIPSLRNDICIPDYCFTDPAPSPHLTHIKPVAKLEEPLLNAWFGPKGTVSPLHTDPYHNILAQVVGYKYIRLYAPDQTDKMYPCGKDEAGVDMSNTSEVDLDEAMRVWSEISCWQHKDNEEQEGIVSSMTEHFVTRFARFKDAQYVECILGPGECLYVPVGWWHYVRSLTASFSVSFWFN